MEAFSFFIMRRLYCIFGPLITLLTECMVAYYSFYGFLLLFFLLMAADIVARRTGNRISGWPVRIHFLLSALSGVLLVMSDILSGISCHSVPASDMLAPLSMVIALPSKDVRTFAAVAFPAAVSAVALMVASFRLFSYLGYTSGMMHVVTGYLPIMICALAASYVVIIVIAGNTRRNAINESGIADNLRTGVSLCVFAAFMMYSVLSCCSCEMPAYSLEAYPVLVSLGAAVVMALRYLHTAGICRIPVLLSGSGRSYAHPSVSARTSQNGSMKELYDRISVLFEKEMPYLDGDLTISDVARELYTNKAYISRAVNEFTGKNFCQYVNHYRIMHSVKLFRENPYLRVSELAEMSGFHTQVSFNMAFRLVMEESPGEWCRKVRLEFEKDRRKKERL